jgi:hypothetical protein
MKQSRRRLLIGSVVLVAGLVVGAFSALPSARERARTLGRRLSRARLTPKQKLLEFFGYLKISDEVADEFISDYRAHVRDVGRMSELGEDFYTRFLLSTDFFQNGADESRALTYVAIYGPTITPCYNPLARLD